MPDARAVITDMISLLSFGVKRSTNSILSSIFSITKRSMSESGAAIVIWEAEVKILQISSLLGRLVIKSWHDPRDRDCSRGKNRRLC